MASEPLRGSTADLVGIPQPNDPDWLARQQADLTRLSVTREATPNPELPWRPGDVARALWDSRKRPEPGWRFWECDAETGNVLRDDTGRMIPVVGIEDEEPARGFRTLADISDDPPQPLLLGIAEPSGPILMYAGPGVGKGSTGAWMSIELLKLGMKPAIYDCERRPREWARRVSGLSGGDLDVRDRICYIEPSDLPATTRGRPLWEAAPDIGRILKASGSDVLFVDSILPAVGVGEERLRSDAQTPFLFVGALDALGIPSISFGHPPKGQPEGDPFGSMAWLAAMRLTWIGTRAEGDAHRVRWRPRKRNERGSLAGVLLTFEYGKDGRPCAVTREDDDESTREWLLLALVRGPRGLSDLADELLEDGDEHITEDSTARVKERLGRALRRMAHDGAVLREGPPTGRGVRWRLNFTEGSK